MKDSTKRKIKSASSTAASIGSSWLAQAALTALVPAPVQIPLRILHFLGTVGIGSVAARAAKKAVAEDVEDVMTAVEAMKD